MTTQQTQTETLGSDGSTYDYDRINPAPLGGGVISTQNQALHKHGSKRDFANEVLLANWGKSNLELGGILGCTVYTVSRLRRAIKSRPQFLDLMFDDYIRLRNDPDVRKEVKFQLAAKMIGLLIENNTTVQGSNVQISIRDDVVPSSSVVVDGK